MRSTTLLRDRHALMMMDFSHPAMRPKGDEMSDKPRFTLQLTLRDMYGFEHMLSMAIGLNEELRISARAVSEAKAGFGDLDFTVRMMRVKEMRRDLFREAAIRLSMLMADRMEDAEGWHDTSRVEPARKQLGGRWEP